MEINKLKDFIINLLTDELSDKLTYHGAHHTLHVLEICKQYTTRMQLSAHDANLLYTAALIHDTGFIKTYENHEEESIRIAKKLLPEWNYSESEIETIAGMIRATKIPQVPSTILEQIIGDADLDYLGTDLFYSIGETLYKELIAFNRITSRKQWDEIQLKFLQNHRFHTSFAQKHREPAKKKYLEEIREKLKESQT